MEIRLKSCTRYEKVMAGIACTQKCGTHLMYSYWKEYVEDSDTVLVLVRQFGPVTVIVVPTVRVGTP